MIAGEEDEENIMSEEEEITCTPPNIVEKAAQATSDILPPNSRAIYEETLSKFERWKKSNGIPFNSYLQTTLLAYFSELAQKMKASTLWSRYSMLKSTINLNHGIDISSYAKLLAFLRRKSDGYISKKSKIFSTGEVREFLDRAPDDEFLADKVVVIFGVSGAMRVDELVNVKIQHVEEHGKLFQVKVPLTKNKKPREFTISEENSGKVKKYMSLRSPRTTTDRFFVNYQKRNGKAFCTNQAIGRNKIAGIPKKMAIYLALPNPESYTGHALRRTSATLLANAGANEMRIMNHGGWSSLQTAKRYVENSATYKKTTANLIQSELNTATEGKINNRVRSPEDTLFSTKIVTDPFIHDSPLPDQVHQPQISIPSICTSKSAPITTPVDHDDINVTNTFAETSTDNRDFDIEAMEFIFPGLQSSPKTSTTSNLNSSKQDAQVRDLLDSLIFEEEIDEIVVKPTTVINPVFNFTHCNVTIVNRN